jgi:hypothetical protein
MPESNNNNLLLLIIAGIIALVVLHMTSNSEPSDKKTAKINNVVKSESTPVSSPASPASVASTASAVSTASTVSVASTAPTSSPKKEKFSYTEVSDSSDGYQLEGFQNKVATDSPASPAPKAESVIKSAKAGNEFGGGKFSTKLTGAGGAVGPNTTNVNGLSLENPAIDYTLGVTPVISKEKKEKKLTAKDLLPKESKDDWFDMPYDKKQMYRIENENLLAGASTQSKIGIDTQGQTLKNASHDLRAAPPNPKFNVGPWLISTIEPDYNIKPIM